MMIIPRKQMQKIAEEVGNTIKKDVNIMDETGNIIASTDENRIGILHIGAVELLKNHLDELIIEQDEEGVRRGINLPLCIENKVIGVVGITGAVENVQMLGVVIKKMTEIMILDWCKGSQRQAVDALKRDFLIELLFGEDDKRIELASEMLHFDVNTPGIISVMQIDVEEGKDEKRQSVFDEITNRIKKGIEINRQQLSVCMGVKVVSIHNTESQEQAANLIRQMKKEAELRYPCKIYSGIGGRGEGKAGLKKSYMEADVACRMAKIEKSNQVKIYRETDLSMLLIHIPQKNREAYVNEIFKNCDSYHRKEILHCLKCYINNNGSISKISEELYIHKNTLQYRLAKIKTLTGYDPRILREAIPLAIALYLKELSD